MTEKVNYMQNRRAFRFLSNISEETLLQKTVNYFLQKNSTIYILKGPKPLHNTFTKPRRGIFIKILNDSFTSLYYRSLWESYVHLIILTSLFLSPNMKKNAGALCNLVPFVQFKSREKHPWRSDTFITKFQALLQLCYKSITSPLVFLTFYH